MNKKLLLFGIFVMVLLVSVPSAEAGWFEDLVDWFADLFGIGQKEAEELIESFLSEFEKEMEIDGWVYIENNTNDITVYTPQGVRVINDDGSKTFTFRRNVLEDNKPVSVKKAKSLKGKYGYKIDIDSDGTHLIDVVDFNISSIEFSLNYDKDNLQEYEIEIEDGKMKTKLRIIEEKFDIFGERYNEETEIGIEIEEGKELRYIYEGDIIGKTFKLGANTSPATINSNATVGLDTFGRASVPSGNWGGDTNLGTYGDSIMTTTLNVTPFIGSGQDITASYFTFWLHGGAGFDFAWAIYGSDEREGEREGLSNAGANESQNFAVANTTDTNNGQWLMGNRSVSSRVGITPTLTDDSWLHAEMTDLTEINRMYNKDGFVKLIFEPDVGGSGSQMYTWSRTKANGDEWYMNFTYQEANDPPNNPIPLFNSTITEQTNYTNETLSCNFLCNDPDTETTLYYNVSFLKDNVSTIEFFGTESCSDPEYVTVNLESDNTTRTDLWSCQVQICDDSSVCSSWVNSSQLTIENSNPNNPLPLLNTTTVASTNYTDEDLNCAFICSDGDSGDTLTYDAYWYKNGIFHTSHRNTACSNPSSSFVNMQDGNTTQHDIWGCTVNVTDNSGASSSTQVSNNMTILNNIPTISPTFYISSEDGTNTTNQYINCSYQPGDVEGDTVTTDIEWLKDNVSQFTFSDQPASIVDRSEFILTSDNTTKGDLWSCQIRVYDSFNYSDWRNSTSQIEILGTNPTEPGTLINSTTVTQTNYTTEDLACNFLCDDGDTADTLTYDLYWYKDGVPDIIFTTESCVNPSYNSPLLTSDNTSLGELWSCSINITDNGGNFSSTVFSDNVTIETSLTEPFVYLNSTTLDQQNYTNETLACNFLCDDSVGAYTLTYDIYWYNNSVYDFSYINESCNNPSYNSPELAFGNTSVEESWTCTINITNSIGLSSSTVTSNAISITTTVPYNLQIVYPSPANETATPTAAHTYNCTADDLDADPLYYEIYQDTNNPPTTLIANETGASTNTSADGTLWWRCRAVDIHSVASPYSNTRQLIIDNSTVKNYSIEYVGTSTEGTSERFEFNVSYNPIGLDYVDAKLVYQNVYYTLTQENLTDALTRFYIDLVIPNVIIDPTTTQFYFNITNAYLNGSLGYEDSINYTQIISGIGIFSCDGITNSSQVLAYNFTLWDEINNTKLYGYVVNLTNQSGSSIEANLLIWKSDISINNSILIDVENTTELDICISPVDEVYNVDIVLEYVREGYNRRWYYIDNGILNNITQNEYLYLLDEDYSSGITIIVQDSDGTGEPNVIVKAQRYYTGLDAYTTVAMAKTDDDGEDYIYLEKYNAFYRFIVLDSNIIVHTSIPKKIGTDEVILIIGPETVVDVLDEFKDVSYTMTWNNDTKTVLVTYNSPTSKNFCLQVKKISSSGKSVYYENCNVTSSSGTLIAKVNESGTFQATFYAYGSPQQVIDMLEWVEGVWQDLAEQIGLDGIAYTILLTGTFVGLGLAIGSATLSLMGVAIGIISMTMFGLINVTFSMIIGIIFVIIIAITRLRER